MHRFSSLAFTCADDEQISGAKLALWEGLLCSEPGALDLGSSHLRQVVDVDVLFW